MTEQEITIGMKVGDRVERLGSDGPKGTIKSVRVETVRTSLKQDGTEPPGVCITVLWDNGTMSHFVPEGLRVIS